MAQGKTRAARRALDVELRTVLGDEIDSALAADPSDRIARSLVKNHRQ